MKPIYSFWECRAHNEADLCRKINRIIQKNQRVVSISKISFGGPWAYFSVYFETIPLRKIKTKKSRE